MRIPVIAGNWKMHKTVDEALTFLKTLRSGNLPGKVETVICAPYPALPALVEAAEGSGIGIGAQNLHWAEEGAYTGEVSARMLTDIGVRYAIIGHSERRAYFAETDETVNRKGKTALQHGLVPILCVGESLEEREQERTKQVVR
ncbi:triosephosphate isomerase, partial [Klebsiella pneumoniae]